MVVHRFYMPSKMSFPVYVLLLIHLTVPFCATLVNVREHSNQSDLKDLINVTSTASFVNRSEFSYGNSTGLSVSSTSVNANSTAIKNITSGKTNTSKNHMVNIISARQAGIIWKRIRELILAKDHEFITVNNTLKSSDIRFQANSKAKDNSKTGPVESHLRSAKTQPVKKLNNEKSKLHASERQFSFHPFLPYGKEVVPDEKISFHDVLPIKMVKFIKSMVEDAPWEQMFMKMVRMVVDQFVDKIIEKMFAHHEEDDDKWRSFDNELTPTGDDSKHSITTVVRLRRSALQNKSDKGHNWGNSGFSIENRLSKDHQKEKGTSASDSWLDSILDYLFPEESKSDLTGDLPKSRRKRYMKNTELTENLQMSDILNTFFIKLYELQTGELASEQLKSNMKKVVRHQLLSSVAHFHSVLQSNSSKLNVSTMSDNSGNSSDVFSGITEKWTNVLKPEPMPKTGYSSSNLVRLRRFANSSEEKEDTKRLWQANRRNRPMNLKARGECSLRRACNTGRLLARLPSVKDITLQLKSYRKEPHWDALVWGMTKKKCSKIFCKRQRSPKGSKHHWALEERRHYRNDIPTTRSPRFKYAKIDPSLSIPSLSHLFE